VTKLKTDLTPAEVELKNNRFVNELRAYLTGSAGGVNVIRFMNRPSNPALEQELYNQWKNLYYSEFPENREFAVKLARYAIAQSGLRSSNVSFFRYIPKEIIQSIYDKSILDKMGEIDGLEDSITMSILQNYWYEKRLVPRVGSTSVKVFNDGDGNVAGYRLDRKKAARLYNNQQAPMAVLVQKKNPITQRIEETELLALAGWTTNDARTREAIYRPIDKKGQGTALKEYTPVTTQSIISENNAEILHGELPYVAGFFDLSMFQTSSGVTRASEVKEILEQEEETTNPDMPYSPEEEFGNSTGEADLNELPDGEFNSLSDDELGAAMGAFGIKDFQLSATQEKTIKELDEKLTEYLTNMGVSVEAVNEIKTRLGNDAVAVADFIESTLKVAKGKADVFTLAEEAGHFFMAMLGKNNPLYQKMMKDITKFAVYQEVVNEYGELYEFDENRLRFEAAGKLISRIIVNEFTGETKGNIDMALRWYEKVWNVIKNFLKKFNLATFEDSIVPFKKAAEEIMTATPEQAFTETYVQNNFDLIIEQLDNKNLLTIEC
jgi:hypothetical protein